MILMVNLSSDTLVNLDLIKYLQSTRSKNMMKNIFDTIEEDNRFVPSFSLRVNDEKHLNPEDFVTPQP